MRRLVSSSEAAEILGLSLQGVHYRIKKGQLKSMKKDGKTYVYVEKEQVDEFHNKEHQAPQQVEQPSNTQTATSTQSVQQAGQVEIPESQKKLYELVYKAKEDQITDLKENLEAVKEQYKTEIYRLDKNQKQILDVFQSEVDLLKSAFHEMKNVYQLEHNERMEDKKHQYAQEKKEDTPVEPEPIEEEVQLQSADNHPEVEIPFMDLKEFYAYMKGFNKTDAQIKYIILDRVKAGDKRFIYKKGTKEVIIFRSDFADLV